MSASTYNDKTIYISGAGSGIGYETALVFAKSGARIVASDLQEEGLARLSEEVTRLGCLHRCHTLDVTDEAAMQALVEELTTSDMLPNIVINNAGIGYIGPFTELSTDAWRRTLDVNVISIAISCRLFANKWKELGKSGHLVNVASMASVAPMPNLSAYVASKYAVEGLCEVLAMELEGSGISVTCIHPGVINTSIVRNRNMINLPETQIDKLQKHYLDDGADPVDVAQAIMSGVSDNLTNVFVGPGARLATNAKRFMPRRMFRGLLKKTAGDIGYL